MTLVTSSQLRQFLADTPPFAGADPSVLSLIEGEIECQVVPGGDVLFRQGDAGDRLYVVISGRLRATINHEDGHEEVLGEIGRGQSVGEMALIADAARSATVRAVRDTEVASLSKHAYERVLIAYPRALLHLTRTITQRYLGRIQHTRQCGHIATLAVVPATAEVACPGVVRQLSALAGQDGRVAHVRRSDVSADAQRTRISELECGHDLVILEADGPDTAWARQCVKAADRVLLVAAGGSAPEPDMAWARLRDEVAEHSTARWDLALLWPGEAPHDTARWLASGSFDRWHHLRAGQPEDIARLARWVRGRAVGLVLSGGGARAFVHVGVIRALREAHVPIDAIGGTSMGAVIAAFVAAGMDDAQTVQAAHRAFIAGKPLADVTIPAVSLVSGRRISRLLRRQFGDTRIEDTPLSMFAISSNLTRACAVEHRQGSLWRALRASVAIPGVISPSIQDGDILVDGGVIDNLPIRPMLSMGVGQLIAVDAAADQDMKVDLTDRDSYRARDLLRRGRRRPDGSAAHLPGILDILLRSVSLGMVAAQRHLRQNVDLHLSPATGDLRMFDWKCLDRAAARGYEHAKPHVARWLQTNRAGIRGAAA